MSIVVIHGDNVHQSRSHFFGELQKYSQDTDKIRLDGKRISLTQFVQATQSSSLFNQKKLVIIEDLQKNKSLKTKKDILQELVENDFNTLDIEIIIWESKKLTPAFIKKLPHAVIREFKLSSQLFSFLDSIIPGSGKRLTSVYQELIKTDAPEMILFMISRHITDLIKANHNTLAGPGWKIKKIKKQASRFSPDKLLLTASKLLEIDFSIKSGTSAHNLNTQLSIMLATI